MTYTHVAAGAPLTDQTINDLIDYGPNMPAAVHAVDTGVTSGTSTSTSFTNSLTTSGIRGIAFVAPPSGKVFVSGTCGGANSTIAKYTLTSFEIRAGASLGAGTVFQASDENTASQLQTAVAANFGQHAIQGLVTGLTPGTTYNACLTYRVDANTGTWNRRSIRVIPVVV